MTNLKVINNISAKYAKALVLIISCLFFSTYGHAKIDIKKTKRLVIPQGDIEPSFTQADMLKIIPLDSIANQKDTNSAISKIADGGAQYILNNTEMKNSTIVKSADRIQENLKTDVVVKADGSDKVEHKFTFQLEAFQNLAKVEYIGWLKAKVSYKLNEAKSEVMLNEKVLKNKDLFLKYTANPVESASSVGVGWSW